jgi:adenylate cyclase
MKAIFSRLSLLVAPFAIGLYLSAGFAWIADRYFQEAHSPDQSVTTEFLTTLHQKSVDFRLKSRGERSGSPQVALLAIDEKAVSTVGRWPWPREVTAKAVDNAIKLGAKVLAFDIVFSEPSTQAVAEAFKAISQKTTMPDEVRRHFEEEITRHDGDLVMSEVFGRNADHLVLGSFSESEIENGGDVFDLCINMIFSLQPEFAQWVTKEKAGIINLSSPPNIPETLKGFFNNHFSEIAAAIRSDKVAKSAIETHDLNALVTNKQLEYCYSWLDPANDETYSALAENWAAVAEAEGGEFKTKYKTYDSWIESIRHSSERIGVPQPRSWTMNLPLFSAQTDATNTGYFNAYLDPDGTIRKSNIVQRTGTYFFPSIALKAFLVANNYNAQIKLGHNAATHQAEIKQLSVINDEGEPVFDVPVDGLGRLMINYAGQQKIFAHVSMADLLSDGDDMTYTIREQTPMHGWQTIDKKAKKSEYFKDKIFILGATATGIYDLRVTPFENNYPGQETHANVLDNLVRRDFLVTNPQEAPMMLIGLLALGALLALALNFLGSLASFSLATLMFFGIGMLDKYLWFGKGTVVTIVLPLALIVIIFVVLISYKYFTEERGKKELRSTFQKYVSPAIVEEILSDPSMVELGGRKAHVTIFFSDVRGFTTISEKLDPRALSDLLNEYLTPMTDLVFKNRGTLDKYMGDAIMAFFGAPVAYKDHAKYACRCALQNLEKLYELQAQFKQKGLPEIDIGIGLNTGDVSVGNMGSQTVRSYTVMGDAVNLASRLEGTNKQYGTKIIISEFTHNEVKDSFVCRELDWVRVKGKVMPVKIFELIAEGKSTEKVVEMLKWYQDGYQAYHEKRWDLSVKAFESALSVNPTDPVSKLYMERVQEYLITPPADDWDGVFDMKTK